MIFSSRRWTARGLFLSWAVYWLALATVKLPPAIYAIWRATHGVPGNSNVNVNATNHGISITVVEAGRTTWTGSTSVIALALWIAGPPLLLWLAWVMTRPRPAAFESATRV